MTWKTNRANQLPTDWPKIRAVALNRANHTCNRCRSPHRLEVHHKGNPNNHSQTNLEVLCHTCHQKETHAQALQAKGHGPLRQRPTPPHPGARP
jgi:5-methylcytosine-specific restriction endonuclease McrA